MISKEKRRQFYKYAFVYFKIVALIVLQLIWIAGAENTPSLEIQFDRNLWICGKDEACVIADGGDYGSTKHFESQNDCRLSCGKYGAIWPMPTGQCLLSNERVHFDPKNVQISSPVDDSIALQFLRESFDIFLNNIARECLKNCSLEYSPVMVVNIAIDSINMRLDWATDESYALAVITSEDGINVELRATTVYGARHGFETLSNLITGAKGSGLIITESARIADNPQFPHRGILLDTARNFMPVAQIKATIDAMAASKMNVFHWHVVDSQSFPIEITQIPELQRYGAYSSAEIYTKNDTENIIKYARLRGIRVLIEIDGPSHASSGWQWGAEFDMGNMAVCINQQPWRLYCVQPPCGQLNPFNKNMYGVMKEIYKHLASVLPIEETIHMGGDEVHIPCWNATKEITDQMIDRGMNLSLDDFYKLWSTFHLTNLQSWNDVNSQTKSSILWSSHLTDPAIIEKYIPKKSFIIQTWVSASDPLNAKLIQKGYRIIISTKDAWYLDHGFWGGTRYYNWATVYNNQIDNHDNILGGEVCMWSEYVNRYSVESRIWPRAGAAAERLWSNPSTNSQLVKSRFKRYIIRLISRGIQPDAILPEWCFQNENQCWD